MNDSRSRIPRRPWAERMPVFSGYDARLLGAPLVVLFMAWVVVVSLMMGLGG